MRCFYDYRPEYEHIVWEQKCVVREEGNGCPVCGNDISIVRREGKYGLIYTRHHYNACRKETDFEDVWLCNCEYDAIYNLKTHSNSGYFVAFSGGRCGLLEIRRSTHTDTLSCKSIVACSYSSICWESSHGKIAMLYKDKKVRYFNLKTGYLSQLYDRIWTDLDFLVCERGNETVVVDIYKDKIIYKTSPEYFVKYMCRYRSGFVFVEDLDGVDVLIGGEPELLGTLVFYNRARGKVFKTRAYKKVTLFTRKKLFLEYMVGFSYETDEGVETMWAKKDIFSREDVAGLQPIETLISD